MQPHVSLSPRRMVIFVYARTIEQSIKKRIWIHSHSQSLTTSSAISEVAASLRNSISLKPSTKLVLQKKHESTLPSSYHLGIMKCVAYLSVGKIVLLYSNVQ